MDYYTPHLMEQMQNNYDILDFKRGDVNGDRIKDNIYLIGKRPFGTESPFTKNITLMIQDGSSGNFTRIPLQENAGYNPTLFLADFTGDRIKDILVSIDSGGSGGYAFYFMFSFLNNKPNEIFNSEKYSQRYTYEVKYRDNFEVMVRQKDTKKKYILNIEYKGTEYLAEIYDTNGKLKEPIEGWVNPLGGLYPIDYQRDGIYELYAERRIAGRYNADGLGYVQTSLEWNDREFVPFFQTIGILG